jgi:acyl dehydratase
MRAAIPADGGRSAYRRAAAHAFAKVTHMSRDLLMSLEGAALHFEDLHVGDSFMSTGRTITEADIVGFAGLSGDYHALHTDETYAGSTPHGRRIAHGMLIVAVTAGLLARLPVMRLLERTTIALAGLECRFLRPTFIGDTIRVRMTVAEKLPGRKPDRGTLLMRRSVLNQRDEVVVEGTWRIVVRARPGAAERAECQPT